MEHLVYCDKKSDVLEKLLNGSKTLIIRGAAGRKLPHGRVFPGETLFFVENDGSCLIKAKGKVKSAFHSEKMTEEESKQIVSDRQSELQLSAAQIKRWAGKKVLCLIEVEQVEALEQPLVYDRQKNMDDWITVEDINTILEGQSEKYVSVKVK